MTEKRLLLWTDFAYDAPWPLMRESERTGGLPGRTDDRQMLIKAGNDWAIRLY